jgi:MOSC domain-containing protein YiiM
MKEMKIVSLNIGMPRKLKTVDQEFVSGVGKQRVEKAYLTKEGFENDGVELTKFHGGPDRAVLFYCYDHYRAWEEEFKKQLIVPVFGENITIAGLSEADVHIGDVYQIGEALVQITQSRIPCNTLSKYNEEDTLLGKLVSTGFTGYLGRVLQEGWIEGDSTITRISRVPHSISVLQSNELYFHDKDNVEGIKKLLTIEELASAWREKLIKRLNQR